MKQPNELPTSGNSLVIQWLGLSTFTAVGPSLIPSQGTIIPRHMASQKKKKKMPTLKQNQAKEDQSSPEDCNGI